MATVLPKDVSKLGQEVKLFGKWETQECVYFCTVDYWERLLTGFAG